MAIITIPLDAETARLYTDASIEEQKKMRLLLSLWLRDFARSSTSLKLLMDQISDKAQARGMTAEVLDSLLHAD